MQNDRLSQTEHRGLGMGHFPGDATKVPLARAGLSPALISEPSILGARQPGLSIDNKAGMT